MATAKKTSTKPAKKTAAKKPAKVAAASSTAVDPAEVKAALERVARVPPEEAVSALLHAWRACPSAEIAEALDAIPLPLAFAEVTSAGATDALARLNRLIDTPRDPRVSKLLVSWVADPPYHATGSKPFHTLMHQEIERHADPRAIDDLKAAAKKAAKVINGTVMKAWVPERSARTADALRELYPSGVPPLPRGLSTALAAAKKAAASGAKTAPATAGTTTSIDRDRDRGAELLEAIRQHPEDDGARAVYADYLTEKSDPRGELITLQLARGSTPPTPEQEKREMALLRKNARRWLGELNHILGSMLGLTVRPWQGWGMCFARGFLTATRISGSKPKIKALTNHPDLATVEHIQFADDHVPFLNAESLRSLRSLSTEDEVVTLMPLHAPTCLPKLRVLEMLVGRSGHDEATLLDTLEQMPNLEDLRLNFYYGLDFAISLSMTKNALRRLKTLTRLTVTADNVEVHYERASKSEPFTASIKPNEDDTSQEGRDRAAAFAALARS